VRCGAMSIHVAFGVDPRAVAVLRAVREDIQPDTMAAWASLGGEVAAWLGGEVKQWLCSVPVPVERFAAWSADLEAAAAMLSHGTSSANVATGISILAACTRKAMATRRAFGQRVPIHIL
jgi:hypothetical protein